MEETLFRQELQKRTAAIEELLKEYLPAEEGYQKTVIEAMNYSLMAGGKRLRPMLMQETYKMFGGKDDTIEPFMAAIEMIHTYSLVHDDLPAMVMTSTAEAARPPGLCTETEWEFWQETDCSIMPLRLHFVLFRHAPRENR